MTEQVGDALKTEDGDWTIFTMRLWRPDCWASYPCYKGHGHSMAITHGPISDAEAIACHREVVLLARAGMIEPGPAPAGA